MSEQYHTDYSRVSKTMLGHFLKAKSDYCRYFVTKEDVPKSPTKQMMIGTAVHAILLEQASISDVCCVYPDDCFKSNGHINPKPASAFRADNPDKMVMKEAEIELVERAVEAVRSHEINELITHPDARFETIIKWTDQQTGLDCRAMVDFFVDMGDRILAYDIKTTEQIYPGEFGRIAKRLRYWLQDAHYSSGLQTLFGKPVDFSFWCVEVTHPFRIAPRRYDDRSKEVAQQAYRRTMDQLAAAMKSGDWTDEWTQTTTYLSLGPWDVDLPDQELEGFDDDEE